MSRSDPCICQPPTTSRSSETEYEIYDMIVLVSFQEHWHRKGLPGSMLYYVIITAMLCTIRATIDDNGITRCAPTTRRYEPALSATDKFTLSPLSETRKERTSERNIQCMTSVNCTLTLYIKKHSKALAKLNHSHHLIPSHQSRANERSNNDLNSKNPNNEG